MVSSFAAMTNAHQNRHVCSVVRKTIPGRQTQQPSKTHWSISVTLSGFTVFTIPRVQKPVPPPTSTTCAKVEKEWGQAWVSQEYNHHLIQLIGSGPPAGLDAKQAEYVQCCHEDCGPCMLRRTKLLVLQHASSIHTSPCRTGLVHKHLQPHKCVHVCASWL